MPFLNQSTLTYPATNVFPNPVWEDIRDPTSADYRNFIIGTEWINATGQKVWFMVGKTATSGAWIQAAASSAGIQSITGDSGGAVSPDMSGNIDLLGSSNVVVTGTPVSNTLTITLGAEIATNYICDSGSATPSSGNLNVEGSGSASTSGSGNTITINSSGGGLSWNQVTMDSALVPDNGYVVNSGSLVTLTLPSVAALGANINIVGKGSGGWQIAQNAGQTIYFGTATTTPGVSGNLASTQQRDCIALVCITASTEFEVMSSIGNIQYV